MLSNPQKFAKMENGKLCLYPEHMEFEKQHKGSYPNPFCALKMALLPRE